MKIPATQKRQEIIWALFYHRRNANEIATYLARPYNEIRKETDFFSRLFFAKEKHDMLSPSNLVKFLVLSDIDIVKPDLVKPLIEGFCSYKDLGFDYCQCANKLNKFIFFKESLSEREEQAITVLHKYRYPVKEICRALPHLKSHRVYSFIKFLKASYNPHQLTLDQVFNRLVLNDRLRTKVAEKMAVLTE